MCSFDIIIYIRSDNMNYETVTVQQMRDYDKYTIDNFCPSKTLMMRAAQGIYDNVDWKGKKTAIICGSGNNGGDGYALSVLIKKSGENVSLVRLGDKFSDDGKYYYDMAMSCGVEDILFVKDFETDKYDILVDCILGTGFTGEVRGNARLAIQKINQASSYVVSADINSGMNGDTGEAQLAVKSDITVSIGFYKAGMVKDIAKKYIGKLVNVDIGIVRPE